MNSEEFNFEVPIVNLDEVPLVNPEDQDCSIIVPTHSQTNNPNQSNTKGKSNHKNKESSTLLKNTSHASIVIDVDDREDDCTIIDDQPDSHDNLTKQNSPNSSRNSHANRSQNKLSEIKEQNINEAPIELDEDSDRENDCSIIETNVDSQRKGSQKNKTSRNTNVNRFEEIYRKNKVMADVIERCLDMENSTGMLRIINRTLIPIYNDTSEHFKQSDYFQKFLTKTLGKLETLPNRKFSHLKELCEIMKAGMSVQKKPIKEVFKKKKVQLTTLKRNLNGEFSTKEMKSSDGTVPQKKIKHDVINVDDDDDDVIITSNDSGIHINDVTCQTSEKTSANCNIDEHNIIDNIKEVTNKPSNIIEHNKDDDVLIDDTNSNFNKENLTAGQSKNAFSNIQIGKDVCTGQTNNMNEIANINQLPKQKSHIETETHTEKQNGSNKRIKILEKQIKTFNTLVKNLEMKEVYCENTNDAASPYVESEYYKRRIISIYKELCQLNGTEAVKRREVRLKVAEGRHEGPVRFLEKFINDNIDKDGNPPFPDMLDVTYCVDLANEVYKMGLSKKEVEKEAQSLFVHYGRTVQKARQKREWRHLMRYVKEEVVDPADEDPTLQARLEENAKLAVKNEMDLLDRYAQMEKSNPDSSVEIAIAASDSDNDSDSDKITFECNKTSFNIPNRVTVPNSVIVPNNGYVLSTATALSNQSALNSSASNIANKIQTNHNFDTYNPQIIPTVGYPLKYIVIDQNMIPIGVVVTPPPNFKSLSTTDLLKHNLIDDSRYEINSDDAVRSTVHQHINNNHELEHNKQLESNEVTLNLASNNVNNIQIINDSFENAEAYIETDIKPNIYEDSVQYSEITTNSDVDISTNADGEKGVGVINNNEVTSSSEVCAEASKVVHDTVSRINIENTCELVNDTRLLEIIGDKVCVNNAESTKSLDKTSRLVNGIQSSHIENTPFEILNDIQSAKNGKHCKVVNKFTSDGADLTGVVNVTRLSEIESNKSNTCLVDDASTNNRDTSCELVNDNQSTLTRVHTCQLVNNTGSSNTEFNELVIKKECHEDIPRMLEALGDNFTVTIIDIEDPFEVIEISDSSDSEDDV